jgi:hypothetical protein
VYVEEKGLLAAEADHRASCGQARRGIFRKKISI